MGTPVDVNVPRWSSGVSRPDSVDLEHDIASTAKEHLIGVQLSKEIVDFAYQKINAISESSPDRDKTIKHIIEGIHASLPGLLDGILERGVDE